MTDLATLLHDDDTSRTSALRAIALSPEHVRSAMVSKLAPVARDAAGSFDAEPDRHATTLARACAALAMLRVEAAKHCLLRIADEGSRGVKATLAQSLRGTTTSEGRAVLVHLLSDDEACREAIVAIGAGPWPEVLPGLIEVAEADEGAAEVALVPIARCGELGGPAEAAAAVDFLLEQLDDDRTAPAAAAAVFQLGRRFPALVETAKRTAKSPGLRRVPSLFLLAAGGDLDPDDAAFAELARSVRLDRDAARRFLGPLLDHSDERVRAAAAQTARALDLR